ncbi:hypothetical protein MKX01_042860 [Papaver californicum]|nr:hypothetical protein MKX01_042860 [Papaver californicum]
MVSLICKLDTGKKMGTSRSSIVVFIIVLLSFYVFAISSLGDSISVLGNNLLQCLSLHSNASSIPIYTPNNPKYLSILHSTIHNLRFNSSTTPKPILIVVPSKYTHAQRAVICCKKYGVQMRIRSGGHDYEGVSYVSYVPFILLDFSNLRRVSVDVGRRVAWIQSGATTGQVYYRIAEKSPILAFPAGICTTVGIGGHLSGGGYGSMLRKYGLAADNVVDANIVDAQGRILNRKSMGEDLFWAIRGGGGGSFGVVLSWKIKLVIVPPSATTFAISKTFAEGAVDIVYKWQEIAHKLPKELFITVNFTVVDKTLVATFRSMFLGDAKKLENVMKERFPELGLESNDYTEMSWIQSVFFWYSHPINSSLDILLNISQPKSFNKIKSDYVKEPISRNALRGLWDRLQKEEINLMAFVPYGGKMSEISESETPFPHRDGNIFKIVYYVEKEDDADATSDEYIGKVRRLYEYMTPFVSKSPREAYANYRDLDLGRNSKNGTAYWQAKVWGSKYFKNNFDRLVYVKSNVDPENFFRHEQSIPSFAIISMKTKNGSLYY